MADRRAWMRDLLSAGALYASVSAGGALGALMRWAISLIPFATVGFPWATLFANATGSFAIGFFAHVSGPDGRMMAGPRVRHFVMTGVLGGYTTFSIFSLETLQLAQAHAYATAAVYAAGSITAWLGSVWLGDALARRYSQLRGAR